MARLAHVAASALLVSSPRATATAGRSALVIGNAQYRQAPLKNAGADAQAISQAFSQLGYDTTLHENLGYADFVAALREFTTRTQDRGLRLIYYAGHGFQVSGRNHLVPVDVQFDVASNAAPERTIAVDDLLQRLTGAPQGVNVLVLDACRANPFTGQQGVSANGRILNLRSGARVGLASQSAPFGTVLAYSTAPGRIATDSPSAAIGVYAKHFLRQLGKRGVPIEMMLKQVRVGVSEETVMQQVPWESSSLIGELTLS